RRWLELLKDCDTNIQYHPGKANVVADGLSRKSGMIAGIKVEEEIIRDLEQLDIRLYVYGQHGYWASLRYHPGKANVVADALSRKSGMIAGIKVEEEIIRDLECLGIELYVSGQHGYWASLRIKPDLISRIKEAQKEDSEIWTIVENLNKQVEFRLDDDNVLWQDTRLVVPNDATLREDLLSEAHSSPFLVHLGSTKMYHNLKQYFWWSGMKRDDTRLVVLNDVSIREALLTEAHSSPFSVHPGFTKMYHDLKQYFWWSGMKRDVATFVA
nr:retrotransposon protein, putative, Ty3-gypsy subclass [Tanacetum cinerariifolium]